MWRTGCWTCRLLIVALFVVGLYVYSPAFGADAPKEVGLTILHTNDVHGMLMPFDYDALGTKEKNVGGVSRRATLIRQIKAQSQKAVLVMDAGDVFVRGPMEKYEGEPDFAVMNAVPYDVMTLGNDEFRGDQYTGSPGPKGLEILRRRIKQAQFPIVCANVIDRSTGKTLVPPYVIIERGGIRVGIFGVTSSCSAEYPQTKGLEIKDPIQTAKQIVTELEPKCDFIIALTHIGYPLDLALTGAIPSIGAIIGGHSHTWVFAPMVVKASKPDGPDWWVGGPIVCQDGEYGKCLGRLDLALRQDSNGHWRVARYQGRLVPVTSALKPASDVEKVIEARGQ